jgi:hypothetical protein
MLRSKTLWSFLMVAVIITLTSMIGVKVEADCTPCGSGGRLYGNVEWPNEDPAPSSTIVYAVCDINDPCNGHSEQCPVSGSNSDFQIWPDCPPGGDKDGTYTVWAVYTIGGCEHKSQEEVVEYDGLNSVNVGTLVLDQGGDPECD